MNEVKSKSVGIQELYDLIPLLNLHPNDRHALLKVADNLHEAEDRRNKVLDTVRESVSQLRLDMKYLIFDLEATRRERDALKNG